MAFLPSLPVLFPPFYAVELLPSGENWMGTRCIYSVTFSLKLFRSVVLVRADLMQHAFHFDMSVFVQRKNNSTKSRYILLAAFS